MTSDYIGGLVYCLIAMVVIGMLFLAIGFICDYILPHFPKIESAMLKLFGLDPEEFDDDNND